MVKTGDLYSGSTSQTIGKSLRQTVNEDNVAKKHVLRPYAQVVFDELEKLKAEELDIKSIILQDQTVDNIKLELAVRKRTYNKLIKLQSRFNIILKSEPKNETEL